LADEPGASWILALPPAEVLCVERSIQLLAYLENLLSGAPGPTSGRLPGPHKAAVSGAVHLQRG